jgi:hypothetical protein
MGQAEQDCKDRTNRTGLPAQDFQHRAAKIRQPGQDKKETTAEKTARTRQLDRTGRIFSAQTGQSEQDIQGRASRQERQNRTSSTALSGQYG